MEDKLGATVAVGLFGVFMYQVRLRELIPRLRVPIIGGDLLEGRLY